VHSDIYSVTMVHMAASFLSLQESICAERWFRAAWWGKRSCVPKYHFLTTLCTVHEATFGGGEALFNARLGNAIQNVPKPLSLQYGWD
jgi:hypothetical protein